MYGIGWKYKNEKAGHSTSFFTVMYRKDKTHKHHFTVTSWMPETHSQKWVLQWLFGVIDVLYSTTAEKNPLSPCIVL